MGTDPGIVDAKSSQATPQDFDGPVEHPGVSTLRDGDFKYEETKDGGSFHSQSTDTIEPAPIQPETLPRTKSIPSSVRSRTYSVVPRSRRRGLLGRFAFVIPEVEKPYEYKRSTKWFITLIVALAAAAAPMGSSIFLRTYYFHEVYSEFSANCLDSCTSPVISRPGYYTNDHQSFGGYVYAIDVYIPSLVVFVLGDTWTQNYLSSFICSVYAVEHYFRHINVHWHAYHYESSWRRGCSFCKSLPEAPFRELPKPKMSVLKIDGSWSSVSNIMEHPQNLRFWQY